ncbi:hypothetical protein QBC43DRAFT_319578 [Cladorrhinum sp. PSN259]|nr:hypothetical protein QBC43DRAFT_319578 [Cladorrhinum sp. PSN259]
MADPISLVGLTAGLVSLGLQISEGAFKYIDALKCRNEEIATARQQIDSLKELIQTIDMTSQQFQTGYPAVTTAVHNCIATCKTELMALENLVAELSGRNQSTTGARANLKGHGKRLMYPFERSKIEGLEKRLDQANGKLMLVLQTLGIETSSSALGKLLAIEGAVATADIKISNESHELKQQIQDSRSSRDFQYSQLSGQLTAVNINVSNETQKLRKQVLDTTHLQGVQYTQLSAQFATTHQAHLFELEELKKIRTEGATQHAEIMHQLELSRQETQRDIKRITGRLVAKPGALKEICDATTGMKAQATIPGRRNTKLRTPTSNDDKKFQAIMFSLGADTACFCRHRRNLERKISIQGPFRFFTEKATTQQHFTGCPAGGTGKSKKQEYGLICNGLERILSSAIKISFAMHTGAGAWSVTPTFTYYPTVDANQDPAFRIMKLLDCTRRILYGPPAFYYANKRYFTQEWPKFVALALVKIISQLRQNKLSPRAVDSRNWTLLHYAARLMSWVALAFNGSNACEEEGFSFAPLLRIIKTLIFYNVPACDYDIGGKAPLALTIPYLDRTPSILLDLVDIIFPSSNDMMPIVCSSLVLRKINSSFTDVELCLEILNSSAKTAEAQGCGPLSLAILANDLVQTQYYLEDHPGMLSERTIFSQTPLHLACDKPGVLRLLLDHADSELLNHVDSKGGSALQWAFAVSGADCKNQRSETMCSRCACAEPTLLLLNAGSVLSLDFYASLGQLLHLASHRCRKKFIQHLRKQREDLKALALVHLSASEIHDFGLDCEHVLDSAIPQVVSILKRRGVSIPATLIPENNRCPDLSLVYPVYRLLTKPSHADLFFQAGFCDMDRCLAVNVGARLELVYMQWLDSHTTGFLDEPFVSSALTASRVFNSHVVFWLLGRLACFELRHESNAHEIKGSFSFSKRICWLDKDWVKKVHVQDTAFSGNLADSCRCNCSIDGCVPFTYLLKWIDSGWVTREDIDSLAGTFRYYLTNLGVELEAVHHHAALRYMTYTALGIPHTCCNARKIIFGYEEPYHSTDEIDEIQEEHADPLALMEELLEEFEKQVDAIFARDEKDKTQDLVDFWKSTWVQRMKTILDQLEGDELTEEERLGAESIGVIFEAEIPTAKPMASRPPENPYDRHTWDHWYWELDQIAPGDV